VEANGHLQLTKEQLACRDGDNSATVLPCRRDGRRPGEVSKALEFDTAGLSEARRAALFPALRAGEVPRTAR
jgi:hypothetical protein